MLYQCQEDGRLNTWRTGADWLIPECRGEGEGGLLYGEYKYNFVLKSNLVRGAHRSGSWVLTVGYQLWVSLMNSFSMPEL